MTKMIIWWYFNFGAPFYPPPRLATIFTQLDIVCTSGKPSDYCVLSFLLSFNELLMRKYCMCVTAELTTVVSVTMRGAPLLHDTNSVSDNGNSEQAVHHSVLNIYSYLYWTPLWYIVSFNKELLKSGEKKTVSCSLLTWQCFFQKSIFTINFCLTTVYKLQYSSFEE